MSPARASTPVRRQKPPSPSLAIAPLAAFTITIQQPDSFTDSVLSSPAFARIVRSMATPYALRGPVPPAAIHSSASADRIMIAETISDSSPLSEHSAAAAASFYNDVTLSHIQHQQNSDSVSRSSHDHAYGAPASRTSRQSGQPKDRQLLQTNLLSVSASDMSQSTSTSALDNPSRRASAGTVLGSVTVIIDTGSDAGSTNGLVGGHARSTKTSRTPTSTHEHQQQTLSPLFGLLSLTPGRKSGRLSSSMGSVTPAGDTIDGHHATPQTPIATDIQTSTHCISSTAPTPTTSVARAGSIASISTSRISTSTNNRDSSTGVTFDFDKMLSTSETKKFSSTPDRMRHIEVKKANEIRLEAKGAVVEKDASIVSLLKASRARGGLGSGTDVGAINVAADANSNTNASATTASGAAATTTTKHDDDDDDDDDDILGTGGASKPRKNETVWEFLKYTGPEDIQTSKPTHKKALMSVKSQPMLVGPIVGTSAPQSPAPKSSAIASRKFTPSSAGSSSLSQSHSGIPLRRVAGSTHEIDQDDEDDDDLIGILSGKPKENMSLADFLRTSQPPEPVSISSPQQSSATSSWRRRSMMGTGDGTSGTSRLNRIGSNGAFRLFGRNSSGNIFSPFMGSTGHAGGSKSGGGGGGDDATGTTSATDTINTTETQQRVGSPAGE